MKNPKEEEMKNKEEHEKIEMKKTVTHGGNWQMANF